MIVDQFSNGYYITEAYVEPSTKDSATVNDQDYRDIQREMYDPGEDNRGIIFRVRQAHIEVMPDRGTPSDVLELPKELIEAIPLYNPPTHEAVLVPKPWLYSFLRNY